MKLERLIKKFLSLVMVTGLTLGSTSIAQADTMLNGAGATFPYPIYSKWFDEYNKVNPDVKINYQSIGSGGGIRQITARTVDFGATDGPMSNKKLFKADGKIIHIPTVLGAVVPSFNVQGLTELNLTGETLAGIYLGNVKKWNDPAIQATNPDANLPASRITVIHRSDGAGTTFAFSDFLSKVSPEWKDKVGTGKSLNWPVGLGGKGNEGVSGLVKNTKNSIGYISFIYAEQNEIPHAAIKNKEGEFVKASVKSISAAAAGSAKTMPADYRVSVANAPGSGTFPISTFTWLLVYEKTGGKKGKILKNFLEWMLEDGQRMAPALLYAPLPDNVNAMVKKTIQGIQ